MALSKEQKKQIVVEVLKEVYGHINPKVEHAIESALSAEAWTNMLIKDSVEKFEKDAPEMIKQGLHKKIDEYDPSSIVLNESDKLVSEIRERIYEIVFNRANQELEAVIGLAEARKKSGVLPYQNGYNEIIHEKFPEIRALVETNIPILLTGPTGSGKSFTSKQVAVSLGLDFRFITGVGDRFEITGYNDASGKYVPTEYFKAFTEGGLFCIDEIDTSDPVALTVINTGLANGQMSFPNGRFDAHEYYRTIATANTYGTGSDSEYVGRNQLDAASLNRLYLIHFDYSHEVEEKLCPNKKILEFLWRLRQASNETEIKMIISTRDVKNFNIAINNGLTPEQVIRGLIIKGHNVDIINKLIEKVQEDGSDIKNNEYFSTMCSLKLIKRDY